jgi:hypothetical protein
MNYRNVSEARHKVKTILIWELKMKTNEELQSIQAKRHWYNGREKAFSDVMKINQNYPWLGHDRPRTLQEMKEIKKRIEERISFNNEMDQDYENYMEKKPPKRKFGIKAMIIILGFLSLATMSGCKKSEEPKPQGKLITQTFTLETILTQDMGSEKAWDKNTWVYNYSSTPFELKISNANNSYTKQVSITDLLAGGISFQMLPGVYSITYSPVHSPRFSNVLDVSISMSNVSITGSPVVLQGNLADGLVILDLPGITNVQLTNPPSQPGETIFFKDATRDFWYAYTDHGFTGNDNITIEVGYGNRIPLSIDNFLVGKVYWVQSNIGPVIQLNIPVMSVQSVIL